MKVVANRPAKAGSSSPAAKPAQQESTLAAWPDLGLALAAAKAQVPKAPAGVREANLQALKDIEGPRVVKDEAAISRARDSIALSFAALAESDRRSAKREGRPPQSAGALWLELSERVLDAQLDLRDAKSTPKDRKLFSRALIHVVVDQALAEVPADQFIERFAHLAEHLFEAKSPAAKKRLLEWVKRGQKRAELEDGLERLQEAREHGLVLSGVEKKLVLDASRRSRKDPAGALTSLAPFLKRADAFFENPLGKAAWPNLSKEELRALREKAKAAAAAPNPVAKEALGEARLALLVAEVEGVSPPTKAERLEGVMLALAIGDALGGPTEFMSREALREKHGLVTDYIGGGWLDLAPGEFTDDTQMAVAMARSIVDRGGFEADDIQKRFVKWLDTDPKDVGNLTRQTLELARVGAGPELSGHLPWALGGYDNAGNGSVMRLGPVAILTAFKDLETIEKTAMASSAVTHADPRCTYGAAAVSLAVSRLLAGSTKVLDEVIEYLAPRSPELASALEKVPSMSLEEVRTSGYVVDTVQAAFWALHHAGSIPEGLVRITNLGEDTDTAGATAGILLGAKFGARGIPESWLEGLQKKSELRSLAAALGALAGPST